MRRVFLCWGSHYSSRYGGFWCNVDEHNYTEEGTPVEDYGMFALLEEEIDKELIPKLFDALFENDEKPKEQRKTLKQIVQELL